MHGRIEDFQRKHAATVELIANVASLVAIVVVELVRKAARR